ncbi:hypothetical protein BJ742DRAFT_852679 [Cladochytrium replicatum]|nr:hypothetical protein BJ742DRAFT_852679 [Cladochytrium replicatum]
MKRLFDDSDEDRGGAGKGKREAGEQESYAFVGTEQPADASDVRARDRNNFLPLWKQEVRDEKGRKRLHGAFTGGFSAGYFNTVGSKEGWQPSQFVSSRSNRSNYSQAKAEDYMDEEDLQELASARLPTISEEFDSRKLGEKERMRQSAAAKSIQADGGSSTIGALPKSLIADLIGPGKDAVGVKLLRQMGWREGQGIGPRIKRDRKADGEEDVYASQHTFAPQDQRLDLFLVQAKRDVHGLGFDPYAHAPELRTHGSHKEGDIVSLDIPDDDNEENMKSSSFGRTKQTKDRGSKGFGVGVFEDDDDEDVYAEASSNYNRVIRHEDDDEGPIILGSSSHSRSLPGRTTTKPSEKTDARGLKVGHDGRTPLPGFTFAVDPPVPMKLYPMPTIPPGWIPVHNREDRVPLQTLAPSNRAPSDKDATVQRWHEQRMAELRSNFARTPNALNQFFQEKSLGGSQVQLTADQRRAILGEVPLAGPERSVFSLVSIKEQERLQMFMDKAREVAEGKDQWQVKKDVAEGALKGFMPFGNDSAKQARYKRFLEVNAEIETEFLKWPPHMSQFEINHEKTEFAKAAQLYRPLSGLMASRFTTSTTPASSSAIAPDPIPQKESEPTEVSSQAAQVKMYGPLTRTVAEWYPDRLLSKRFGVPHPFPNKSVSDQKTQSSDRDGSAKERPPPPPPGMVVKAALEDKDRKVMAQLMDERDRLFGKMQVEGNVSAVRGSEREEKTRSGLKEWLGADDDVSQNQASVQEDTDGKADVPDEDSNKKEMERPPMDLFKAIFADSDEDEDDDDGIEKDKTQKKAENKPERNTESETITIIPEAVPNPVSAVPDTTIDPSSFRPTFVPKGSRTSKLGGNQSASSEKTDSTTETKSSSKTKKRKGVTIALSWEEEGDHDDAPTVKKKAKSDQISIAPTMLHSAARTSNVPVDLSISSNAIPIVDNAGKAFNTQLYETQFEISPSPQPLTSPKSLQTPSESITQQSSSLATPQKQCDSVVEESIEEWVVAPAPSRDDRKKKKKAKEKKSRKHKRGNLSSDSDDSKESRNKKRRSGYAQENGPAIRVVEESIEFVQDADGFLVPVPTAVSVEERDTRGRREYTNEVVKPGKGQDRTLYDKKSESKSESKTPVSSRSGRREDQGGSQSDSDDDERKKGRRDSQKHEKRRSSSTESSIDERTKRRRDTRKHGRRSSSTESSDSDRSKRTDKGRGGSGPSKAHGSDRKSANVPSTDQKKFHTRDPGKDADVRKGQEKSKSSTENVKRPNARQRPSAADFFS